jgi:hypothetical protein
MLTQAPFRLPPGWLRYFGYSGPRRYVGLYWEPCGDEACFTDGQTTRCGADHWLLLDLLRRADVRRWVGQHGIHLGDSEREATHWLIADAATNEVYAAPWMDARLWVSFQTLPEQE